MPEFTVVVTTRDRPELLRDALASVQAQTIEDFECIVVDDGSATASAVVPDDPRFRVIEIDDPIGVSAARNRGVTEASGAAVCFLDDDDLYEPRRLELAREGLRRAEIALCWSALLGDGEASGRLLNGDVRDEVLDATVPHLGVIAVRRAALVPFDETYRASGDVEWWLRQSVERVATVPEVGYRWRRHDGIRRGNPAEVRIESNRRLLREHRAYFRAHRRARAFRYYRLGIMHRQVGRRLAAIGWLVRSLLAQPSPRAAAALARSVVPRRDS